MGEKQGSKPTITLGELAAKLLMLLVFLEVLVPHLKAICITMRDQPWKGSGPQAVDVEFKEAQDAA